ncbi:MAG: hypothetical protein H6752_02095 [Candidatus Omnitrophica bacterium]|nr:hypothetical protein [Candidatus Omnitrophota bacterium]
MSTPTEHRIVQARILAYAQEIGWTFVPREEAEARREGSLFLEGVLEGKVGELNPRWGEGVGVLLARFPGN